MRAVVAHSGVPVVDRLPAGLARPPRRRTCSPASRRSARLKIQDDPGGDLPGRLAALRRRRARARARLPAARGRARATSSRRRSRAAAQFDAAARAIRRSRRCWPRPRRAGSARWPRSARPAASGCSVADGARRDEDAGPRARDKAEILRRLQSGAARQRAPLGPDVGAPDGLSSRATRSAWRSASKTGERAPAASLQRTVVKWIALYAAAALAAGHPHAAGDRSGARRHAARRLRRRRRASSRRCSSCVAARPAHSTGRRIRSSAACRRRPGCAGRYLHMDHHLRQFGA